MCGIAGFVSPDNEVLFEERERLLDKMCKIITHRGPDEQGMAVRGRAALGMRRLSIIDVKTGQQPIFNEDENLAIVFNGEIYNYRELKADLEKKGYRFKTNSDTETILLAYQEYGSEAVKKLRGMFAFAIWNFREETLFLARDRIGKKPLFYSIAADGAFVFGSELKSLRLYPHIDLTIDPVAVNAYLTFGYIPESLCIYRSVKKVEPGTTLTFRNGNISESTYWDIEYPTVEPARSEADYIEELREKLLDAVRCRLISEVPLGAFLSGGIDSSTVVGLMSKLSSEPVKTFSIGFNEDSFNELKYARMAAKHFGTDHHEFIVTPHLVDIVDELVWHFDEPFADPSALPTYMVSKMAREHVTVVLSGDGGDELFAGYTRYLVDKNRNIFNSLPTIARTVLAQISKRLPHSALGKNYIYNISLTQLDRYIDALTQFNLPQRKELLTSEFHSHLQDSSFESENLFREVAGIPSNEDPLVRLLYLDSKTYLPGDILTKVDRMTMANSLEARSPLLDQDVMDFAATVPSHLKLKGSETKYILKKTMEDIIPTDILYREKQGFGVPIEEWINNELSSRIRETLLSSNSISRGYFNKTYIETIYTEHGAGRRDNSHKLWALFMFELWNQRFVDTQIG